MEKKEATQLIEKTFNARFDLEQFTFFLKNLLNDYDEQKERDWAQGNYIYESFREHINRFKRLGIYTDPEGNEMELLVIETKATSKLEKARTSLRNFVIKRLNDKGRDYALAAFYSRDDNGADWRFSFIKIEHESFRDQKGKIKTKKELTPAKRYSFLVGEHEQAHTAQKQLLPVLQNTYSKPSLEDLEGCFSIEKVTDEFFDQYKDLYIKLSEHFENDELVQKVIKDAEIETARFTKKLLGQIVFLYFLQKKGWLGVPKNEPWGKGEKKFVQKLFDDASKKEKNFFNDYLKFLFYEALAKGRTKSPDPAYYKRFDCKIPFLNGGLFEADYDWENVQIVIPNELFRNEEKNKNGDKGTGVLDVFDRYNFTIKEDEPLEKEVAVDPEMLGKVFENMLEIKERKSKGAFYTPREIVHYMCQESLIQYLFNSINDDQESYQALGEDQLAIFRGSNNKKGQSKLEIEHYAKNLVSKEDIEVFIRKGFLATENDTTIIEKGKETSSYKFQLPESIRVNADIIDNRITTIKICDPSIGSGAFPVGLLHELVTAQKVLLPYLSKDYLVSKLSEIELDYEDYKEDNSKYIYRVKRHTIQESIYGVDIDASAIDIARLRLWLSLIVDEDDFYSIEALPNLDYKIIKGNSIIGLPEKNLVDDDATKKLEVLKDEFFGLTDETRKKQLRKNINNEINRILSTSEEFTGIVIDFDFRLFFSEVWHKKNGFDIVIGNPPYISYYGNNGQEITDLTKSYFKNNYDHVIKTNDRINSMNLLTEKGLKLLNKKGFLSFITNKTLAVLPSYINLREYLLKNYSIDFIVTNLDPFEAIVDCVVFGINKEKKSTKLKYFKGQLTDSKLISQIDFQKNGKLEFHVGDNKELIDKIEIHKNKLEDILTVNRGVNIGGCSEYFLSKEKKVGYYPYLAGTKNIKKFSYKLDPEDGYFIFDLEREKQLRDSGATIVLGNPERYIQPHLFIPESGQTIMSAICLDQIYGSYGLLVGTSDDLSNLKLCCAILNSEIISYYAIEKEILRKGNKATPHVGVRGLNSIPIPVFSEKAVDILVNLVDYIVFLKSVDERKIEISFFEALLNSIIYESYFSKEIEMVNKHLIKHIPKLNKIDTSLNDEGNMKIITSVFNKLYDPNHVVRNNLETLDSIEEIRIIKDFFK
ncbi:MAG: class I SAM-dependent DNA methyltransferase [Bacteroidetes bacterium]|nr:class I SAM-dependent DNA methyltransferase [Bacteroidota bacterium]